MDLVVLASAFIRKDERKEPGDPVWSSAIKKSLDDSQKLNSMSPVGEVSGVDVVFFDFQMVE